MSTNPLAITDLKLSPIDMKLSPDDTKADKSGSFGALFAHALNISNDAQFNVGYLQEKLVTGQLSNTHELAIAGAKAEVLMHLTTQIASKLTAATTQIMQMQI